MSEIRVTTLKDTSGGNSSSTADIFSGRAKAWVNFNGQGAVAIRAQFNVSSITDNGVGDYTVNFSSALADANYCTLITGKEFDNTNGSYGCGKFTGFTNANTFSTGSVRVSGSSYGNTTQLDPTGLYVVIFR